MAFRKLPLPEGVKGELYLHSMPGRNTPFADDIAEIAERGISVVLRLTSDVETERKSPEYWDAIKHRTIGWEDRSFPISDFGVPADFEAFVRLVETVAARLKAGKKFLIHCAAGIGRTGTLACALLISLGVRLEEAERIVNRAGSSAESEAQIHLLRAFAAEKWHDPA